MPRLRLDDFGDGPSRRFGATGNGLRSNQYAYEEDTAPRTQREKDDRFDMYRDEAPRIQRRPAVRPKTRGSHEPRQLWFVACLICALGAFCIFADSINITVLGIPLRFTSFEILLGTADSSELVPGQVVYMSAMPIAFMIMFALFAYLKEDTFNKAWLALIAVAVFVIALQVNWCTKLPRPDIYNTVEYIPGDAVIIEIACAVGLIIVIVCQRILSTVAVRKDKW